MFFPLLPYVEVGVCLAVSTVAAAAAAMTSTTTTTTTAVDYTRIYGC